MENVIENSYDNNVLFILLLTYYKLLCILFVFVLFVIFVPSCKLSNNATCPINPIHIPTQFAVFF